MTLHVSRFTFGAVAAVSLALSLRAAVGSDLDEFKVKREQVFAFSRKLEVTRAGDKITIRFESKGFCDVTVAIENADKKIVRHLASGVLGPRAPEPFTKNSKQPTSSSRSIKCKRSMASTSCTRPAS